MSTITLLKLELFYRLFANVSLYLTMSYFGSTNTFREGTFRSLHIVSLHQDKDGATECKKCPVGTTSKENGSRDFIQCQGKEKKF